MNNQTLNEKQSFEIIKEMIDISKNKIIDDGKHFILWGTMVFLCCLIQFGLLEYTNLGDRSNLVWFLMLVGIPMSMYLGKNTNSNKTVLTEIYQKIWIGFGITLGLIINISASKGMSPISPLLALIGFAVYLTYNFLNYKPFLVSAIYFWISALGYQYVESISHQSYEILYYGIVVLLGYLIPGFMLYFKHKNSNNV